ncbi:hypothetical protein JB92DRAFT_3114805 [Gautieria morchelliformis]|nr:hypothetical protein JB92DRAFT_3114805 [Gautieria morchelliformis]
MNHGALLPMFPLAATKDLKLVKRPDLIEQVLYIANFNKHKKELPDVPAEDLEHIEEFLEDDVNMERGSCGSDLRSLGWQRVGQIKVQDMVSWVKNKFAPYVGAADSGACTPYVEAANCGPSAPYAVDAAYGAGTPYVGAAYRAPAPYVEVADGGAYAPWCLT